MSDPFQYPGDDVMGKALGEALKQARLEAGLSIEEAEERLRMEMEGLDYKRMARAMGTGHQRGQREAPPVSQRTQQQGGTPAWEADRTGTWGNGEFFRD